MKSDEFNGTEQTWNWGPLGKGETTRTTMEDKKGIREETPWN